MRAAAVAVAQSDHILALGVKLRDQNRRLVRLGAAVGEETFLEPSRRNLSQLFGQPNMRLVRIESGDMLKLAGLFLDSFRDLFVAVTDANRHDAAKEIEILLALDIVDIAPFGMVNDQRLFVIVGYDGKKVLLVLFDDFLLFHPCSPAQPWRRKKSKMGG